MRVVTLARKSEDSSTTQSVIEHGCGGLNIDVCRIPDPLGGGSPMALRRLTASLTGVAPVFAKKHKEKMTRTGDPGVYMTPRSGEKIGRWPANAVLQHGPGCVMTTIKTQEDLEPVVEYDCSCGLSEAPLLVGTCKQVGSGS